MADSDPRDSKIAKLEEENRRLNADVGRLDGIIRQQRNPIVRSYEGIINTLVDFARRVEREDYSAIDLMFYNTAVEKGRIFYVSQMFASRLGLEGDIVKKLEGKCYGSILMGSREEVVKIVAPERSTEVRASFNASFLGLDAVRQDYEVRVWPICLPKAIIHGSSELFPSLGMLQLLTQIGLERSGEDLPEIFEQKEEGPSVPREISTNRMVILPEKSK